MRRPLGLTLALFAGLAFLYLPVLVLVIYSFNDNQLITVWSGFSFRPYRTLFDNAELIDSALRSLWIAVAAGALAAVLGTAAGLALSFGRKGFARGAVAGLIVGPLVVPDVIIGMALLSLFVMLEVGMRSLGVLSPDGSIFGNWTILIGHATLGLAYVAVVVRARLADFDRSLIDAARDLGATPSTAFWTVTLPLIAPGIVAGFLIAFTLSLDDLVIASFVRGIGTDTLPMEIFSQNRRGVRSEVGALATLLVVIITLSAMVVGWLGLRAQRRQD